METISYTTLRQNLSSVMDRIAENRETIHVTRKGHESMVVLSESDFNSLQETLYLLSNPHNAEHLFKSLEQAEKGEFESVEWDED